MESLAPPTDTTLVWVDIKRCKACNICVNLCPSGTIAMVVDLNSTLGSVIQIVDEVSCIGCRECELHCPDFAIFVNERSSEIKFAKLTPQSKERARAIKENNFQKIGV